MSKEEIIKIIEELDEQLKKNRKVVENCEMNADVLTLCALSKLLIDSREMYQNMLLEHFGVYYMRGA